ncbi:Ctf8-domain-containing protein [Hygrophoropsis aurantiaca]|uniref:Ctf8-domain-containing protein n=1 Tax=Hygrophoropsis aurantiaca TaxID=72124 RepID=A0ACB8AK22_9AGAM|nr:Ctf8-domain-containing protein [Hygrophoropsis aurantiaca]
MIIPISVSSKENNDIFPPSLARLGNDDLVLIELQGSLEVECNESSSRDGRLVGKLNVDNPDKPTLLIGHHLLEGKIVTLPKPLGVLHRNTPIQNPKTQGESLDRSQSDQDEVDGWSIVAMVKKKLVFSKRPMPITILKQKT